MAANNQDMDKSQIDELAKMFKEIAGQLLEKDGQLIPAVFFIMSDGIHGMPQLSELFDFDRDLYSTIVKKLVKEVQPKAVLQVSEAYIKKMQSDEKYDHTKSVQENGGREVVLINIETKEQTIIYTADIIKIDSYSKPKLSENWDETVMQKENVSGRLSDLYSNSTRLDLPLKDELAVFQNEKGGKEIKVDKIDA